MAGLAATVAVQAIRDRRARRRVVTLAVGGFAGLLLFLLVVASVIGGPLRTPAGAAAASAEALADIPGDYLALYQQAGAAWGVDWSVLAGIGKVECDHGRSRLAGCNPRGTINEAGARGPMQFLGSTWRASASATDPDVAGDPIPPGEEAHGYATDANNDRIADPWQPADAIHAAARLLRRNGAPADIRAALHSYNQDQDYVESVLRYAERYRLPATSTDRAFTGTPSAVPTSDVTCPGGGTTTVHTQIAPAVEALYADSAAEGHLLCGGGYRSTERQIELRREHCGTSDYAIYRMPSSQCTPPTAPPGESMHELGLAIDLTCSGTLIESRDNRCSDWLEAHAAAYGLYPLASEPWHYSTNGR